MGLVGLFVISNVLGLISFLAKSPGFFAFCIVILQFVCGAFKLFIYEFVTEIIFPVSPCFGLAIMHALSGLLSLLINMFAADILKNNPTNETFPVFLYMMSITISGIALFFIMKEPYKLNRSDYDFGRRSTMVTTYTSGKKKSTERFNVGGGNADINSDGEFHANAINRLLDHEQNNNTSLN